MKYISIGVIACALITSCNNEAKNKPTSEDTVTTRADHESHNPPADNINTNAVMEFNDMDREFVMKVGMGNTAEVEAGTMAQQKGNAAGVKDFGSQMVQDHGDAQAKLKIAAAGNINVPDSIDKPHMDMKKKLQSLNGAAFDAEYMKGQLKDHKETIALFEKQIAQGSNSALKEFAQTTLPHLKMHLEKAEALAGAKVQSMQ